MILLTISLILLGVFFAWLVNWMYPPHRNISLCGSQFIAVEFYVTLGWMFIVVWITVFWKSVHSCWILCNFGLDVYSCVNNCILEVCISGGMCKMKPFYPLPRLLSLLLFSPIWVMQTWPSKETLLMWHFKAQYFRTNPTNLGFKRPRSQYLLLAASCTLLYTSV